MNTTRTISDPSRARSGAAAPYTVVGGPRWDRIRKYPFRLTVLVMARGDKLFRAELLRDLASRGVGEVMWVEGPVLSAEIESLARDFPDVRFLLVKAPCTIGERINIAVTEARAPLVLCLWSDTRVSAFPRAALEALEKTSAVCALPVLKTSQGEPIPSWQSPSGRTRRFAPRFRTPRDEGEKCLFPFDYCGVYGREKFSQVGGFDPGIANPYWQKLDFGFRCWLWGERIVGTKRMSVVYTGAPPTDDTTPDEGYKAFFLKSLAVRIRKEMGVLPWWSLLEYMMRSDTGPLYAIKEFAAARSWVRTHRFRFRREPREIVERWEAG
jgi:hypothetical protein